MRLFYNGTQMIKMALLVDLSAIFMASPMSILAWEFSKWYGFQKFVSPFRGNAALLPQSDKTSKLGVFT